MIKKIILVLSLALIPSRAAYAGSGTYANFPNAVASDLRPFARDLGGLLGSGTNQTARVLGFGGFDFSARGVMQFEPERKNGILKKNKPFGLGWVQAEIGMPFRIDGFIKAASFDNMAVAGGGLKYGLTQPQKKVQAMLVVNGNLAAHKFFYAAHLAYGLAVSLNTPVVSPYFGVGMDNTRLTVQTVNDPSLAGRRVSVAEPRYTAGVKMTFLNYGYVSGGYTYTHGRGLVTAGLGLRI
ncbi:MAG: hypothetical protein WCK75_08735 [Elusimicrobiota bacterium]